MPIPYELLGRFFIYFAAAIFCITGVTLLMGAYSFKKKKIVFPRFVLFMLYLFYAPARWICRVFSIKETLVDEILIELRNAVMVERFAKVKDKRTVILPQCMRHPQCKARCDPLYGYECKRCGLCDIGEIAKAADKYDFKVFVIPGDSFVRKIIKNYRPHSCIGVACFVELTESMQAASRFMAVQGVCLLKDGCYNTSVDVEEVIKKMEMCDV